MWKQLIKGLNDEKQKRRSTEDRRVNPYVRSIPDLRSSERRRIRDRRKEV